ncbi:ABC transporter ATP-binding protein [Nonomuraea basaltis]|uniref:ABC transporter ATP-binding protein n=1 Tax=Nonomuraea basaltis TaxID=2495887 RepID=UPI00110C47A9|nr:ABC transporter ATP-binding protein [Nonomuraea basaltis]TMR99898.1 ABC transporter ATP-binding protein [Nonomuraea basaltis]
MGEPLLEIRDLRVTFRTRTGPVTAVDGLSVTVEPGQVLGIVGESGSGKSVSMLSLLKLIRDPNVRVTGTALFDGRDLLTRTDRELRAIRGRDIAMIFQDPMTALTPVYTIGWHIAEQLRAHRPLSRRQARVRAVELLEEVGIADAARRVDDYPHQFSGGMRQRAVIALALACDPRLLIADEPTTALDVTTQAQILDLMRRLRERHGSAIVLITHDIGVVSELADRVLVMYGGRAVEHGPTAEVLRRPRHPYTWGLLGSVPRVTGPRPRRLAAIPGTSVSPYDLPEGCAFAPRCAYRLPVCDDKPRLTGAAGHEDACWLPLEGRSDLRQETR